MYLDFEDYRPDIQPIGRAISWREGVLLSIIVHLVFIILLIFGLLAHGLNGLRLALVGSGRVVDHQKAFYRSIQVIGTILLLGAALHILGSD